MADYKDAGHRPHGVHTGEEPRNTITRGPESLRVTLDTWGPVDGLFTTMYDALQSNWGDAPSRSATQQPVRPEYERRYDEWRGEAGPNVLYDDRDMNLRTGWAKLTDAQRDYVESCFAGKTLPQVLEMLTFEFTIDGVSRAFTHQNVRTRIGAAFMQHGGRDNDWRHRPWTMPETIARAIDYTDGGSDSKLKHCLTDPEPLNQLLGRWSDSVLRGEEANLEAAFTRYLEIGRELYAALVDAGIPWQDARRVLPIGMQTYIHDIYNYLALAGMLAKRLEFVMDWEINCVAQLMVREIRMKCHPLIGKYLMSTSDRAQRAAFAGLESWPPDGKYPNPYERCADCGHSADNHTQMTDDHGVWCEACERDGHPGSRPGKKFICAKYVPKDTLPRTHRPEQMPFWVLAPESMAGAPVRWIPTNGTYPKELRK